MTRLALAAAAVTAVLTLAAASSANAGGCDDWGCGTNGPQLTGIDGSNGTQLTGIAAQGIKARQPVVTAVTLPSGKIVELR
jgi:hypothetical protein